LLGVFYHKPDRLGYPAGRYAPFHKHGPDNRLRQVVTVGDRQLYIDDQEAGPPRDHLVSRGTMVFKAKLVDPRGEEMTGWDWCYKSSWAQKVRTHEGVYLTHLQGLPNVVDLLVYGVAKVENDDDTIVLGRRCSSGESMTLLETFFDRTSKQRGNFTQHTGTEASGQEGLTNMLSDPRRPEGGSQQDCENKEHRDVVTVWVNSSFNETASSLDSLPKISSIWQQAFSAAKSIRDRGILHRDMSFRNVRIDDQHQVKICDFDMAMFLGGESTGAKDRTGTIAFMATSLLSSKPRTHRPVHDCESIFWLCALDLLCRVDIGDTRDEIANIMNPGHGISPVKQAKGYLVFMLSILTKKTPPAEFSFSLVDPKDSSLFFCVTALAKEFAENGILMDYAPGKQGFEDACFDRCVEIIKGAIDSTVQQATEGIAEMSLSQQ
jgi:hypothetical protein